MNEFYFIEAKDGKTTVYLSSGEFSLYMSTSFRNAIKYGYEKEAELAMKMAERKCPKLKGFRLMFAERRKPCWKR
jgi:hypothetical protein